MAVLAIGGGWGHLMGLLVSTITRKLGMTGVISLPAYTVVGAAASLGEPLQFWTIQNKSTH